jgi:hypothetical protein
VLFALAFEELHNRGRMHMKRRTKLTAPLAALIAIAAPAYAQIDGSRQTIPFLSPEAAALAGKMLAICGGLSGMSRLNVTVRGAPAATELTLVVGGIERVGVVTTGNGTAKFTLASVPTPNTQLLDFDPRDRVVELKDPGGTTLLTTATEDGSSPPGTRIRERAHLTPTGAIPGASGRVQLRERRGVQDFDVEIEDVPDGTYDLIVDGVVRGAIEVVRGQGEIEFSDGGDDPDELPLDFDPLGALVQVAQGGTIVLGGEVLADAPGLNVCAPSESTTALANVGPDPDASGDARFRVRDDCDHDFQVEADDLPVGTYEVWVGGVLRGSMDVVDVGDGTEGETEFDTDADEPGEILLDFDPVGQTVEVRQGATVFLSSTVGDPGDPGTCDVVEEEPDLESTGADPDADGKARFRQEADCDRDFRVAVDDLAVGGYELVVGGIVRGSIDVVDVGGGDTEGEIEFDDDPDEPGELLLDFDPRGELVEVRAGSTVYLGLEMPG